MAPLRMPGVKPGTVNGAEDRASLLLPLPQEKGSLSFSSMQAFYDGHLRAL